MRLEACCDGSEVFDFLKEFFFEVSLSVQPVSNFGIFTRSGMGYLDYLPDKEQVIAGFGGTPKTF